MDCNDLLADWIEYCEGRRSLDKSHFYCLLMDDPPPTDEFIESVVRYFPARAELKRRIKLVKNPESLIAGPDRHDADYDRLKGHLHPFLWELAKVCKADGATGLAAQLLSAELITCDDPELIWSKLQSLEEPHCDLIDVVGDHLIDRKGEWQDKEYALAEAFYGMTTKFELCWYLEAPMLDHRFDFESFVRFWALGGQYAWTTEGILIARR